MEICWLSYTAGVALFLFRKKSRDVDGVPSGSKGFRTPLYPVIPLIFIGISVWFVIYTSIGRPEQALAGIVLLLVGLPDYWWNQRAE